MKEEKQRIVICYAKTCIHHIQKKYNCIYDTVYIIEAGKCSRFTEEHKHTFGS